MRFAIAITVIAVLFATACRSTGGPGGNSSGGPAASSPVARPSAAIVKLKMDVCGLLTSDDLKAVQGEAYKDAQRSDRLDGDFIVAQCYYAMPTTANSVVINVTAAKDETGARSPKALWEQTFGGDEEKEREGKGESEREREKAKEPRERREEGEEKEASPPERVKDLGEEAFWVGSPVGGALYMLKGAQFFRISLGGAGDQKAKLNKAKLLAQKILSRL